MRKLILAIAGLAVSGVVAAEGPGWTYGDLSYNRADSGDDETDAFKLSGSFGFADKYHVQGEYYDGEADNSSPGSEGTTSGSSPDFDGYRIAVGINPAVSDSTDFVFQVGYFDFEEDDSDDGQDDGVDGFDLRVGLRSMLTEKVEIFGYVATFIGEADCDEESPCSILGVGERDDGDDFTEVAAIVGGQYFFTDNFSLSTQYEQDGLFGDNASFGVRWTF